jgi:Protein of unknown function (DUF3489)
MNTEIAISENSGTTQQDTPKTKRAGKKVKTAKVATRAAKATAKKIEKRKAAKRKSKPSREAAGGTKKALVLELLRRKEGATIAEITKATNWQNHGIRGFISGTITKKMGLTMQSSKNESGERIYRIIE